MDGEGSTSDDEEKSMEGPIDKLDGERYLQVQIPKFFVWTQFCFILYHQNVFPKL